jgi:signal transduction histidine kinase
MTPWEHILPVPADDVHQRRQKFIDGLRFRAIASGTFFLLLGTFGATDVGQSGAHYLSVLPLLLLLGMANLPYWYAGTVAAFPLRHFYLHWLVDLIIISAILHGLGGVDAPYGFLAYLMIVVTSATFISKRASYIVAFGASVATLFLVLLEFLGLTGHVTVWSHHFTPEVQQVTIAIAVAFYFMFAYLSGTLADQLKRANSALAHARAEIQEQNRALEGKVTERTKELRRRNAEIEEFVHIVTHDLKNLAVGATETARKLLALDGSRLTDRGRRYAGHMVDDTRNMNEMLRHLLAIFRIDQQRLEQRSVNLQELTLDLCRAQAARLEAGCVKVSVGYLPEVSADEAQLSHVVTNLIDNAIKYVGDKSEPEIRIYAEGDPAEGWTFCVADNGIGVAPDQCERIFNLYHRAPDQCVGKYVQHGEGVGLAICKRIVERWGGRIWVESICGQGSKFKFTLPS